MTTSNNKKLLFARDVSQRHWVGNGFYVHGILRPTPDMNPFISPFILMDYASPKEFPASSTRKGVGVHPHRGFETVTFAYQGEVEHKDSSGGGGIIGAGDVQWMTAGRGVVHEEFHSSAFTAKGGTFEMVQLWVNLPKKYKMTEPKYQAVLSKDIPELIIGKSMHVRIIAGQYEDKKGPASTFTPINMFDLKADEKQEVSFEFEDKTNTVLLIMRGSVTTNEKSHPEKTVLIFDSKGEKLNLQVSEDFKGLLLNAHPIDEPIFAYGPFVMNSREEIIEAIQDFEAGKMGSF